MAVFLVLYLAFIALLIASLWKVFEKAGQPGWAALVPFYNLWVLNTHVAGREPIWFVLFFIPIANLVSAIMLPFKVAEKFGKDALFGLGLLFLGFIFYPILAFGDAEHESQTRRGRRSRGRDYSDYDDEDDRPRKKRRDDDEDEEEEERPSKRRRVVDEDEPDERPSKRRRDEDDEEAERPSKRRRNDDDEDDRPRRRRRDDD